jgi:hypothetical protein
MCSSEIDLVIVTLSSILLQISDNDMLTQAGQEGGSAQDPSGWAHSSLNLQREIAVWHTVPLWIIDVCRRGRKPRVIDSGPNAESSPNNLRKNSILSDRSINIIDTRRHLFSFESLCKAVLPLYRDVIRIPDWDTYLPAFGWNIELLIFGSVSWSGFHRILLWDRGQHLLERYHRGPLHQHGGPCQGTIT